MKNLIIIGAGGYGREIYHLLGNCIGFGKEWQIKGFLYDNPLALQDYSYPYGILSSVEDYKIEPGDVFICAIGSVADKKKYASIILEKGGNFINIIHITAMVNNTSKLGQGIIICPFALVSNDCVIGDFVTIQNHAAIGHDSNIGQWGHINAYVFTGGYAKIEDEVTLNTRATVLPKIKVGKGAIVGAGSVVIKNVKEGSTVFGNPAKVINF